MPCADVETGFRTMACHAVTAEDRIACTLFRIGTGGWVTRMRLLVARGWFVQARLLKWVSVVESLPGLLLCFVDNLSGTGEREREGHVAGRRVAPRPVARSQGYICSPCYKLQSVDEATAYAISYSQSMKLTCSLELLCCIHCFGSCLLALPEDPAVLVSRL